MNNGQWWCQQEEEEGRGGKAAPNTAVGAASKNVCRWVIGVARGYC
jgi:hypothetical protein